jgi:hypothetical protein
MWMRPKPRARNEIVDIEWTAEGGTFLVRGGGTAGPVSFNGNGLVEALSTDYGGSPTVQMVLQGPPTWIFRATFHDHLGKNIAPVDVDLHTKQYCSLSLITTVQGVAAVPGVAEQFTVSSSGTGTVSFTNGAEFGSVDFEDGVSTSITDPIGFTSSGAGTGTVAFSATAEADVLDFSIDTDGTGSGSLTTTVQGVSPFPGVQEVWVIDADDADEGGWHIEPDGSFASANADVAVIKSLIEQKRPICNVTGDPGGPYEITFVTPGPVSDVALGASELKKHLSSGASLVVTVMREGG